MGAGRTWLAMASAGALAGVACGRTEPRLDWVPDAPAPAPTASPVTLCPRECGTDADCAVVDRCIDGSCTRNCNTDADCGVNGWRCADAGTAYARCDCTASGVELCNGLDDDCSGVVDDGASCATPGEVCVQGSCACPAAAQCEGGCVDLLLDPSHCGACGVQCTAPTGGMPLCGMGSCTWACAPNLYDCDGLLENGCESTSPCPSDVLALRKRAPEALSLFGEQLCWMERTAYETGDVLCMPQGGGNATEIVTQAFGLQDLIVFDAQLIWAQGCSWSGGSGTFWGVEALDDIPAELFYDLQQCPTEIFASGGLFGWATMPILGDWGYVRPGTITWRLGPGSVVDRVSAGTPTTPALASGFVFWREWQTSVLARSRMDCPRAVELGAVAPDYVGALKADASGIYVTGVDGLRRLGMNGQDMLSMLSGSVGELILTDALVYFAATDAVKRVPKHGGEASRVATANVPIALASSSTHVFWAEQDEATGGYAIRRVRR